VLPAPRRRAVRDQLPAIEDEHAVGAFADDLPGIFGAGDAAHQSAAFLEILVVSEVVSDLAFPLLAKLVDVLDLAGVTIVHGDANDFVVVFAVVLEIDHADYASFLDDEAHRQGLGGD